MDQPTVLAPGQPPWAEAPPEPGEGTDATRQDQEAQGAERWPASSQDSIVAETPPSQGEPSGGSSDGGRERHLEGNDGGENTTSTGSEARPEQQAEAQRAEQQEKPEDSIGPEEMFQAVVKDMRAAPRGSLVDAWMVTAGELFADQFNKVKADKDRVPVWKHRYPKLRRDESVQLLRFFEEAFIVGTETYSDWVQYASAISQDIYNTSWNFKTIVQSMLSKMRWARAPVLNQWADKVNHGSASGASTPEANMTKFQQFMFNPAVFSTADIERLRRICQQRDAVGRRLREGSEDEWLIIGGLAEGTIVGRKMPEFVKSVLDSQERLRLYRTIQAQVEGELLLKLVGYGEIPTSRHHTMALKEDILLAAERVKVNVAELHAMLSQTKTISYNRVQKSIHFFFFNRETAAKHKLTIVPYRGNAYRLANVHEPTTGSVWSRQLGTDGRAAAPHAEYELRLYNVTRFLDIGRLTAFFRQRLEAEFDFEDLDICNPNSRTSTVWRLTIKQPGCPDFLRGVVRLIWFGMSIILKHPGVGRRLQCLRCGNLGHTMARCAYTDVQLQGPGSLVAREQDVVHLEDLARPFASMEEMKAAAVKRLQMQNDSDIAAQAAVLPGARRAPHVRSATPSADASSSLALNTETARASVEAVTSNTAAEPQPKPKKKWVTVSMRGGRKLFAHKAALDSRGQQSRSRFEALAEESDDEEDDNTLKEKQGHSAGEVIEISSGSSQEGAAKAKPAEPTAAAKANLHIVQATPPSMPTPPQLVTLKQRARTAVSDAVKELLPHHGPHIPVEENNVKTEDGFLQIEGCIGVRQVTTPATGNCLAMAVVQAVADHDLAAHDDVLEDATTWLKRGIKYTGLLNMSEQFPHFTRTNTLINVERGWTTMSKTESKRQFRWYLEEYSSSPSTRDALVEKHCWGSSEILNMAASFLKKNIYVLAYNVDGEEQWHCSMYRPSAMTKFNRVVETGQQVPLTVHECVESIRADKRKNQFPLVLRFWGEHYSACVHTAAQRSSPESTREEEQKECDCEMVEVDRTSRVRDGTVSDAEASQDPWMPEKWDGNMDSLLERLQGLTIPHALKCEIRQILKVVDYDRSQELLAFLVNTVSGLSLPEQQHILNTDMSEPNSLGVRQLQQQYQISGAALQQWQAFLRQQTDLGMDLARDQRDDVEPDVSDGTTTDVAYEPSPTSSPAERQLVNYQSPPRRSGRTASQKRQHEASQEERETRGLVACTKRSATVLKKGKIQQASPALQLEGGSVRPPKSRDDWQQYWSALAPEWAEQTHIPFPLPRSANSIWKKAVQAEPRRLIGLVRRFPFPAEVFQVLSDEVLIAWTAAWRQDCMHARLVAYRSRTEDAFTREWLDAWKDKTGRPVAGTTLAPLIDNADDWMQMQKNAYGGDELLEKCDWKNKRDLAQHILCAIVYEKEIRALTGDEEADNGVTTRVARHLLALRTVAAYKAAYYGADQGVNWIAVEQYFVSAFELEGTEAALQY